jgi:2-iminobutanoate/2-iminopropanoate deaminase
MMRARNILISVLLMASFLAFWHETAAAQAPEDEATLLVNSTVVDLLAGHMLDTVTQGEVEAQLSDFPSDWPVVGLGSTDWHGRNGEMLPDGTVGDVNWWWADPNSAPVGAVWDLAPSTARLPFLALAIGDPATAQTWQVAGVDDLHTWLEEKLVESDIGLAGVQVTGELAAVKTSIVYHIPLEGLDLSGGYVGDDYFRFGDYITSTWTLNGLYGAEADMQALISTPGHPLHLHGYQNASMRGGHVISARVINATVTVWPMARLELNDPEFLEGMAPANSPWHDSREIVATDDAPAAIGPYSQGVRVGDLLYTAGQVGLDPSSGDLVDGGIEAQTRQALTNLAAVLTAGGSSLDDTVKVTVYLADMDDFQAMNAVYEEFFLLSPPARSAFEVSALPLGALVEVEAVAAASERPCP